MFSKAHTKKLLSYLRREESKLIRSRDKLEKQDSFKDTARVSDNADIDFEVDEQNVHQKVEVLKTALDRNLTQVRRAIAAIRKGRYGHCDICGKEIVRARLKVFPTATLCTQCREKKEQEKQKMYKKKLILTSR